MKKIIFSLLSILIVLTLCGCSVENKDNIYTEIQDDVTITYIYDGANVVSKNIYNMSTGITTEYVYFYHNNGWGTNIAGVSVVTITKDGQIINQFEDKAQ